jgi:hypothetical protein
MNKINMDEAKILLDCKHLVTYLKEIKEAIKKYTKSPMNHPWLSISKFLVT